MSQSTIISRRRFPLALSLGLGAFAQGASAAALATAVALPAELAKAIQSGHPLLIMVSLEGCPFCRVVRDNYLAPMRDRGELVVVQVDMRSRQRVIDLQGKSVTHDELVRTWGIKIAPTLLFVGRGGIEVAERLVGGSVPDFYGAYLEERLLAGRTSLAKRS